MSEPELDYKVGDMIEIRPYEGSPDMFAVSERHIDGNGNYVFKLVSDSGSDATWLENRKLVPIALISPTGRGEPVNAQISHEPDGPALIIRPKRK